MEQLCEENEGNRCSDTVKEDPVENDLFEIDGLEDTRKSIEEEYILCRICR